jgi:hypothetical protein
MSAVREPSEIREQWELEVARLEEDLMAEFETHEKRDSEESECVPLITVELDAARESARKSRRELEKLWKAVRAAVKDPSTLAKVTQQDALNRARAEAEYEKQRVSCAWELIRESVDNETMLQVTRKATGCDGERNLSVGAARRVFERSVSSDKSGYRDSRDSSREPSSAPQSQARSARLRRNSREPANTDVAEQAKGYRSQRPSGALPPRPKLQVTAMAQKRSDAPAGGA